MLNLKYNADVGFHPTGCDNIASVFDHEVAHKIDKALNVRNNVEMANFYHSLTKDEIKKGLSGYATTNIGEFIAEGWAEYCNNPNPRPISKKNGEIIKNKLNKR